MKQKKTFTAYFMVHGAVIAAIYVVLTILFAPISFGPVQFRISEALCVRHILHRRRCQGYF